MWTMALLGLQVRLRNGLGAYFWSLKLDLDFFTAILGVFFMTVWGAIWGGWTPKIIDFH